MTLFVEGVTILTVVLVPALVGLFITRRFLSASFHEASSEAAEPIWAIVGVTFGLLLGFLVVDRWAALQAAQSTVQDEANDMVNLYQLSYGFPDSAMPADLRGQLATYAGLLVDDEWPALGRHQSSPRADAAFTGLWRSYLRLEPALGATSASYQESIKHLSDLQDARNRRIHTAHDEVPVALWVVLLGGVALMIGTVWLTGPQHLQAHLLMTIILALSLASILFLIRAFNNPFQGDVRVDSEPIERVLQRFE